MRAWKNQDILRQDMDQIQKNKNQIQGQTQTGVMTFILVRLLTNVMVYPVVLKKEVPLAGPSGVQDR